MTDPDFGWHLRAGQWILSNHAVPFTDLFSSYGIDNRVPWYDYSWLFDIFFALLYKAFGLLGFAYLEVAVRVAVPIFLYRMASKLGLRFWPSAVLTALAAYSLTSIYAPRPGMFTIFFFILELQILLYALQTKKFGGVLWLPVIFWFWASIHIQFIHGLIVLGVFVCEPILNYVLGYKGENETFPLRQTWVFPASILATLATPYFWHLYSTVFLYARQKNIYESIAEMLAISFREPYHFAVPVLLMVSAIAIGWSRNLRPLYFVLLGFAIVMGFRSIKDVWSIGVVSIALTAVCCRTVAQDLPKPRTAALKNQLALVVCLIAILAVAWRRYDINTGWIEMSLAGRYPEAAVRYVEAHHLQGPLYNDFSSGGYLIWRLPPSIPVSMDGRTNVHGDERVKAYADALRGFPGWEKDPDLAVANLIIWPTKSPLSGLLRCDARFKQVYSDPQATVFVRQ
ncbi:MAG TPA: hypothetical protein VKD70_14025 [Candidatus Acidoferrum sp.]|nr:hypothetical protein [Candidatus Acidoferrum sp.]